MPAEDWFAVRELEPGIHLLCEPPHVNSYLISGSAEAVLFDTGMGISDIGKLLLISGAVIAAVGGAIVLGSRLGLGRLPGDISTRGGSVAN